MHTRTPHARTHTAVSNNSRTLLDLWMELYEPAWKGRSEVASIIQVQFHIPPSLIHLSICYQHHLPLLSICPSTPLSIHPSVYLLPTPSTTTIHMSIHSSVHSSICLSVTNTIYHYYPYVRPLLCSFIHLSTCYQHHLPLLSICPSTPMSIHPSVYLLPTPSTTTIHMSMHSSVHSSI